MLRPVISASLVAASIAVCAAQTQTTPPAAAPRVIPAGAQFNVVLQTPLTSATAKIDQRFDTGSLEDWKVQGKVVVELGTTIRGFVASVRAANRAVQEAQAKGMGQMALSFDEILQGSKSIKIRASVVAVLDPRRQPDDTRRSSTAGVVGGSDTLGLPNWPDVVVSGGSILPVGIGELKLPVGIVLRIRLDQSVDLLDAK